MGGSGAGRWDGGLASRLRAQLAEGGTAQQPILTGEERGKRIAAVGSRDSAGGGAREQQAAPRESCGCRAREQHGARAGGGHGVEGLGDDDDFYNNQPTALSLWLTWWCAKHFTVQPPSVPIYTNDRH
jgi:hypothetical protein